MKKWLIISCIFFMSIVEAQELYFVDAHSQFDSEVDAELILNRMDKGGVYKTILASRRQRKPRDAAELAEQYPDRIVASVRTKGKPYSEGSKKFYKQLKKQVKSGRFSAMAELLIFHAQKGGKADEVRISVDDKRIKKSLQYAVEQGWPFVVHFEFSSLHGGDRDDYMNGLKALLNSQPEHPFALIHMGQLPLEDVTALIKAHKNIYFLTSHADPVSAVDSKQPWINMMTKDKFKTQWKQLIMQHPDRFVFALDNVWGWQWRDTYMKHIKVWRSALSELEADVAHKVAHGNAERLWNLKPRPDFSISSQ